VSFKECGLNALQPNPMIVTDIGELATEPTYRQRIDWYTTIVVFKRNAIARLRYITDGKVAEE